MEPLMTRPSLLDRTAIQSNPDIVFGDVDGEVVALHLESGSYLHLNSSGSFIFNLLEGPQPRTLEWLRDRVLEEYEIDAATCRQEVDDFVARCVGLDLLRVAPGGE
jgi:hypothetical protein